MTPLVIGSRGGHSIAVCTEELTIIAVQWKNRLPD